MAKLNHKQNVETAGYTDKQAAFIVRKLNGRNVTSYDEIPAVFGATLGGVDSHELADKLKRAAAEKPRATKVARTADKEPATAKPEDK